MKYNFLMIMSLFLIFKAEAQINNTDIDSGFHLETTILSHSQKNNTLYLGQYWRGHTYAIDSVVISSEGKAVFSYPERKLPQGQYFLYIKPSIQVDFLIGNEQENIKLTIDETDMTKNSVSGSFDTQKLWEYLLFSQKNGILLSELQTKVKEAASETEKNEILNQINEFEAERLAYTQRFKKENEKYWVGAFIKGLDPVQPPFPQPKDEAEFLKNSEYLKKHYFDNIDLKDNRFCHTNYLYNLIDDYMQQWIEPIPDSLAAAASRLVAKLKGDETCFQEILLKFTNESLQSNKMGDESIWARLYEDFIKDKNIPWIDSLQMSQLQKMYESLKYNRIGMKAHNLKLETIDGKTINTDEIDSRFTLVYFYDPGCGHCKTEVPKLYHELYTKYKDKGLAVVAINIASDRQEWEAFIKNHNMTDWLNCCDMNYKSEYWLYYDTESIPTSYVLNSDKIIVAKKIDEQNLMKFFDFYLQDNNGTN